MGLLIRKRKTAAKAQNDQDKGLFFQALSLVLDVAKIILSGTPVKAGGPEGALNPHSRTIFA